MRMCALVWLQNKLRDDEKLDALLECLEGPIRDTCIKSYTDRADTSNPLTYCELFSLLEGKGSRLPEDHFRTLLTSFWKISEAHSPRGSEKAVTL